MSVLVLVLESHLVHVPVRVPNPVVRVLMLMLDMLMSMPCVRMRVFDTVMLMLVRMRRLM